MGKPLAIAMLSKLSQETDLRLSKMAFPLHQVQRTSFLDPRADGFGLPAHPFDKILRTVNQLGFLTADQIVTALMKGIAHLAREGKKLPIVLVGKVGGDHSTALGLGLNDHGGMRQTRNDAVANQKMFTVKLFLSGELRNKTSFLLNFIRKNLVFRSVNLIEAVGHTSNGGKIRFKDLIVCNNIDASCKTRDDNRIKLPHTSDQFTTNLFPLRITGSGTNDADELTLTKIEVSLVKQNQACIGTKASILG